MSRTTSELAARIARFRSKDPRFVCRPPTADSSRFLLAVSSVPMPTRGARATTRSSSLAAHVPPTLRRSDDVPITSGDGTSKFWWQETPAAPAPVASVAAPTSDAPPKTTATQRVAANVAAENKGPSVERALKELERLAENNPDLRDALASIQRGPDGAVTVGSLRRAEAALRERYAAAASVSERAKFNVAQARAENPLGERGRPRGRVREGARESAAKAPASPSSRPLSGSPGGSRRASKTTPSPSPANRAAERSSARDVSPAPDDVSPDVAPPSPDYSGGAYGKTTDPAFAGSIVPGARRRVRPRAQIARTDRGSTALGLLPREGTPSEPIEVYVQISFPRSRRARGVPIAIARAWFVSRSRRIRIPREGANERLGVRGRRASPRHPAKQRPAGRRRCRRCRRCRRFGVAETSPGPGSERVRRRVVPRGRVRRREPARVARRAAPRRLRGGDERVSGEDSGVGGRARRGPFESPRVSRRRSAKRRRERCRAQSGDATGGGGDWPGG